jgi:uncharacterized repeat protein (TIGR02543 family)
MKTSKQFTVVAFIAIFFGLTGCPNEPDPPPETFTVTFHANGGTPEPAQQIIEKGKTASEPAAMTKTNCEFEGWYKESGFITKWNFTTDTVIDNISLHAQWSYGSLPNSTIKIYKGNASITDEQMTTAVERIKTAYTDGITAGNLEADFQRMIKSIHVILGTDIVKNGNIIEFGCDAIETYPGTAFAMIAMGLD